MTDEEWRAVCEILDLVADCHDCVCINGARLSPEARELVDEWASVSE